MPRARHPLVRIWSDHDLCVAIQECTSWSAVIRRLGLKTGGGTYTNLKATALRLGIGTEHFTGQAWNSLGKNLKRTKYPIEDYLENRRTISSHGLKLKLWKHNLKPRRCETCGLETWQGRPAPLELDHIDGDRHNNRLENLRILCSNCHAQTPTYCGKNRKIEYVIHFCKCGAAITPSASHCRSCAGRLRPTKIRWPDPMVLQDMVNDSSCVAVARALGVSDTAVRKNMPS